MKIVPMNGHVLVKPLEALEVTPGGIHLPDSSKEERREGEVIDVARDAIEEVAVGDRVLYKSYGGTEIDVEGEKHILLSTEDLLLKYIDADAIPE